MKATVGDRLVVSSRHVDQPGRIGEIVEVHGPDGTAPYVVRWAGTSETAVVVPGPDAHIEPAEADPADR